MYNIIRRLHRDCSGVVAIEFAIFAPLFVFSLLMMADLGMVAYDKMKLTSGVRSAMQYVLVGGDDTSAIAEIIDRSSGLATTSSVTTYCSCPTARTISIDCEASCNGETLNSYTLIVAEYKSDRLMKSWTVKSQVDFRSQGNQ